MEYKCHNCGHEWDLHLGILGIARCPDCRSYDVWPEKFPQWVSKAMQLPRGINDNTPVNDLVNAAKAVGLNDLLLLGCREFRRVVRGVIKEAENPRNKTPRKK
jgi:hypothetical protein